EEPIRFQHRRSKVLYVFFLLHTRIFFTRIALAKKSRLFTDLFMLLYPTADYTKFENYFVTKNENFFRDYRNDANRDIKEALDRHTQGLPDNPEDIKWLEIEMDRQNGQ
ncbi:MAG: hypothetical protein K6G46_04975, partial [Prevotella sp.]|nr:hypothetical protein [Prevotella sp.]